MPFYEISKMEAKRSKTGSALVKSVAGELMKAGIVTYQDGEGPPPHFLPNEEQFIIMLEGKKKMILGDEERIVAAYPDKRIYAGGFRRPNDGKRGTLVYRTVLQVYPDPVPIDAYRFDYVGNLICDVPAEKRPPGLQFGPHTCELSCLVFHISSPPIVSAT